MDYTGMNCEPESILLPLAHLLPPGLLSQLQENDTVNLESEFWKTQASE